MLHCFADVCNLDCGLHLILAVHRQLWRFVHHVLTDKQEGERESMIPTALRIAGCDYMAFQMESYYNRLAY